MTATSQQAFEGAETTIALGWRAGWLVYRKLVPFSMICVLAFSMISLLIYELRRDTLEETAIYSATIWSKNLSNLRAAYSELVVEKANLQGVVASHEFLDSNTHIPLPASLTRYLGEMLQAEIPEFTTTLYSPYPFPWQKDRISEDLTRKRVWQQMLDSGNSEATSVEISEDQKTLRYSIADRMKPSCLGCHNRHPDSPKRDWIADDLAGVLEVTVNLDKIIASTHSRTNFHAASISFIFMVFCAVALHFFRKTILAEEQLRQSHQNLIMVSDHERNRISHFLHDNLGQLLSGVNYYLANLAHQLSDRPSSRETCSEMSEAVTSALQQTRDLARSINSSDKRDRKLETSLGSYLRSCEAQFQVTIVADLPSELLNKLADQESYELYFIVVEAITNAIRHGRADRIAITLGSDLTGMTLEILDNGCGIGDQGRRTGGIGTQIITQRAAMIGWTARIYPAGSGGTTVRCQNNQLA